MRGKLSIRAVGLSAAAVLAVPYVFVMLFSLRQVGLRTTGSLQAALLGIGWNTIVGFEFGLVGVVIVGLVVAGMIGSSTTPSGGQGRANPAGHQPSRGQPGCWRPAWCCPP